MENLSKAELDELAEVTLERMRSFRSEPLAVREALFTLDRAVYDLAKARAQIEEV